MPKENLRQWIAALQALQRGETLLELPPDPPYGTPSVNAELRRLAQSLQSQALLQVEIDKIALHAGAGLTLEDILERLYEDLRGLIPYNRIGLALLDEDGEQVYSCWNRSDREKVEIGEGYRAPLKGSSLETILRTGKPRILNDLEEYLRQHPDSESTRRIVAEGIRSSLTCPLMTAGHPVGFLFFSSITPETYDDVHVSLFQRLADQLGTLVERGRLISALAEQKAESERQNAELKRVHELRSTMLGIAAHDVRSPLSYILSTVEFLLAAGDSLEPADTQALLDGLQRQARHSLTLLNNLLDFTSIELGRAKLHLEVLALPEFLQQVIEAVAPTAQQKGTHILQEIGSGPEIQADRTRLQQVVENFITNAIKYSPPGSQVTVRADWDAEARNWRVAVQDQGPGLQPEDRERLFQPFTRLSARPTGGEKSTGLGLAISRWAVEAHGGEIGVENNSDVSGATFWFRIPANRSEKQAV